MKSVMAHLETKERVKGVHVLVGLLTETWWSLFDFWDARGMRVKYSGMGHENWELTTYAIPAEYVAAVALEPGAVGVLKCGTFAWMPSFWRVALTMFLAVLGDRKSTFEIAEDMEAVYGIKPELERLGSLEDVYDQRNVGGRQDLQSQAWKQQNPLSKPGGLTCNSVVTYFLLTGKIALGESLDNRRYSEIKQESVQDYLRRNDVLNRDTNA